MAPQERLKKRTRSVPAASQTTEVTTPPKKRKIVKEAFPVEDDAASEDDDPNANLLTGFESSDDEDSDASGARSAAVVPKVPSDEKVKKELERANSKPDDGNRGVIYVGRIPHGFYEREMRAYFSQFGDIMRLRLSRNRKTGHSKHYAFIEFRSAEVARIVADTMHNYLMFGHILKCRTVPKEQVHENLWVGANKRFSRIPYNKMEGKKLAMARPRDHWAKKVEQETEKRALKREKLKAIGYDYEPPVLRQIDVVPVIGALQVMAGSPIAEDGAGTLIKAAPEVEVAKLTTITVEHEAPNSVVIDEVETTVKGDTIEKSKRTKKKGKKAVAVKE